MNQIQSIINKYQVIDSSTAQQLLDELMPLQSHWQDCKTLTDYYQLYTNIFYAVGLAYSHIGDYQKSLEYLEPAIKEYNTLSKYGYSRKADFYQAIGLNYCHLDTETKAREAFQLMAFNEFQNLNRTTYAVDVYSYRTPSEFAIKDLRESTLSFSSLFDFNDPVDSAYFTIEEENRKTLTDECEKMASRLISEAYANFRARSLVSNLDLDKLHDHINPQRVYLSNKPEYESTLMWGYYTQFHKGFCVKYNFDERLTTHEADEEVMLAQMNYVPDMPYNAKLTFSTCFLTKNVDWNHEREKRLLYFSSRKSEPHPTIHIFPKCIKAVYLGVRCSLDTVNEIKQALSDKPHVELYQMKISSTNVYALEAVRFN